MSWNQISEWWCRTMHSKAMWPIHGRYVCPDCGRQYPVAWEVTPPAVEYALQSQAKPAVHWEALFDEWARKLTWSAKLVFQRAASLKRSDTM